MTPKEEFIAIFTENIKREGARELLAWAGDHRLFHRACRAPSSTVPVRAVWSIR